MTIRKITGATSSLVARVSVVTGNRIFINKATVTQTNLLATVAQDANVFKSNLILPGTVDHILYSDEGSSRFFRNLLYTADGSQLLISKNFFDPLDLLDLVSRQTFVYIAQRKVDDALLTAEEIEIIFASARRIFDDIAISDRPINLLALQKFDVFTMLDGGIRRYINSNKRETVVIGSGLAQRQSTLENIRFLNTKLLRDTSTVAERKQLAVLQRKTDAVNIIDYRQTNYWLNKYFGDTAPALDLVGVFDGNIFSFIHLAVDALNISEDSRRILTANRPVNDLLLSSEFKTLFINKPFTEQLFSTEVIRKLNLQNKFETVPTLDLPRKLFIKPADNLAPARVTVTDVPRPLPLLGRFETLTAAQTRFDYLYSKPVNDVVSILDLLDESTNTFTARRIFNELMTVAEQKALLLALRKNDSVAIADLFGSALIKIRNENDTITVAEILRRYMRMEKFETANIDDPKALFFRQGTRLENIAIGDVALIARVQGLFEFLTATDSRVILDILLGKQETVPVPDANFYLLSKRLGDVSDMLDFAATGDGAEFKFLRRTNDVLTILDFLDDTRLVFRARRTFREGIFPDDYFARNFWINKTADTVVPASVALGSGFDQRQSQLENISFVDLKTADTVVPASVALGSGFDQRQNQLENISFVDLKTADAALPATVILGSGIDQRQSVLELISFIGLKTADAALPATVALGSGIDQRQSQLENIAFIALKTADAVVPAEVVMDDYRTSNLWINKGLADDTTMLDLTGISDGLNFIWIDQETDSFFAHSYAQPATTYIRAPRDGNLSDDAAPDDSFARNNWFEKTADAVVPATVTMGDYKAQRLFTDLGKFDFPEPIDVFRRLTRTFLKPADGLRQDFTPALDNSTFSPFPARLMIMRARLGVNQTFSTAGYLTSIVTTADTKNHPVYIGQQYTGAYRAGDRLETINKWVNIDAKQGANNALLLKTTDGINNGQFSSVTVTYTPRDRDQVGTVDFFTNQVLFVRRGLTDVTNNDTGFQPVITMGSGIDQRQSNLERISFTSLIRAKLDQGSRDRFDPVIMLDGSTFSPFPARVVLLDAKQGAVTAVSGTTVTARDRDRLFVGQRYGTIRFSGDPMERISFLATKLLGDVTTAIDLANVFDGITFTGALIETDFLTMGSGLNQRQSNLESIPFTVLLSARQGVNNTVSGTTATARDGDRLFVGQRYGVIRFSGDPLENIGFVALKTTGLGGAGSSNTVVTLGSGFDQRQSTLERISFYDIKRLFDTPILGFGDLTQAIRVSGSALERVSFTTLLRVHQDQGTFDRFDPAPALDNSTFSPFPARVLLLDAKQGAVTAVSGTTVTARDRDRIFVGQQYGAIRFSADPMERISFLATKLLGDVTTMLDLTNVFDGITYTSILIERDFLTIGSGLNQRASDLELISFTSLLSARQGVNTAVSGTTVTARDGDRVFVGQRYGNIRFSGDPQEALAFVTLKNTGIGGAGSSLSIVTLGSGFDQRQSTLERISFYDIKRLFDFPQAGSGMDQRSTDLERISFTKLLRVHQDSGTFDRFDPARPIDQPFKFLNLTAKRGFTGPVVLNTIDPNPDVEFQQSSVTITRTAWDVDEVGSLDRFNLTLIVNRFLEDYPVFGSGIDQRQSNLERISFLMRKLIGDDQNMLDIQSLSDGLTFSYLARESDSFSLGPAADQTYPARVKSGNAENIAFVTLKTTGIGGAGSSLSIVTLGSGLNQRQSNLERISYIGNKALFDFPQAGSGIDQRQSDLERVSFTSLIRAKLDQGSRDRFDPAVIGSGILGIRVAGNSLENLAMSVLLDAKQGANTAVSGTTVTARDRDRLFVGQQYGTIRFSGNPLERISFLATKLLGDVTTMIDLANVFDGITYTSIVLQRDFLTLGSGLAQRSSDLESIPFTVLLSARQGVNNTVSGTTVTAPSGDRLFVGQRYGAIRFSGDPLENIGFVNLLTAKRGQNGTVFTQTTDGNNSARTSVLVSYGSYGDDAVGTLDFRTDVVNYVRQPHHGFADIPGIGDNSANSTFPARSLRMRIQPSVYGTNLITSSESIGLTLYGEGNWIYPAISGLSITNDYVTAPNGTLTADRVEGDYIYLLQTVSPDTTYTWSWYAQVTNDRLNSFGSITPLYYKVDGYDGATTSTLVASTLYSSAFTPFEWNRVSVTFTTGPGQTIAHLYPYGNPVDGQYQGWEAYYWGWQLNPGTAADAYIRTTSTAIVNAFAGLSNFVAPTDTGTRSNFVNISARRGVSGTLQFSTIGNSTENTVSSVTIVQTLRDPDAVGILDSFALFATDKNLFPDFVTIGSGIDQRQSNLERVRFLLLTRIKTDDGLGNALDPVAPIERIALQVLNRESSVALIAGTTSAGIRKSGDQLENVSFVNLFAAKRGVQSTVFTQTIDGNNSARTSVLVTYSSYGGDAVGTLDFRTDVVNYFRAPHHGFADSIDQPDRPFLSLRLRARLDAGTFDRFDPVSLGPTASQTYPARVKSGDAENIAITLLLDAKRGVQGTVLLNTIDANPDVEFQQSSVAVTYGSRQPDSVGTLDRFQLFYAVNRFLQDSVLIGSGIDQRQSTLERISFFIKLRVDETPAGGQGINIGPSMLDAFSFIDGLTFTYLQRETDATPALDRSAFSPFPARLLLLPARLGVNQAFSSITVTADTKNHPVYVGTQIAANRKDVLENTFYTMLKAADNSDRDTAISIVTALDADRFTVLKRAVQDSGTFDRFDPVPVLDNSTFSPFPQRLMLLDAKRGLTGAVELKTIDSFGDNAYSSVQITYTSRDRDIVGSIDRALLTFTAGRILQELVTIGSGIDQRHIAGLERTTFFIGKRFDENQVYGQGSNLGPLMLDNFSFNDGLTFVYLQRETDAAPALDNSTFSPFPARLMLMSARLGINQAFSSITVTADTKNDPVYIGTNIAANRKDVLENTFYTMLKVADNSDRDTAISTVAALDADRLTVLKRATQDSGTFDRFDPVPVLDNSTFSPFPARVMLLDAKRGLTGSVELKTIDKPGDNAFSSVLVTYTSRDRDIVGSIDRATLLLTTTRLFQELITIGSGIDQRHIAGLERTSFFIGMRFDENQVYGQGQNLGPLMLDNFSFNDGLTFTYLQRETDAVTAGTGIAIRVSGTQAENISFVNLLTAKAGATTTVSSVNNTAASTDRLFVGQQYGSIRFSRDPLERLFYTLQMVSPKTQDIVTPVERAFLLLKKIAKLDDDTNRTSHTVTIGTSSLGIRVSGQTSENISIQWLKRARRGVAGNVSFSTIGTTTENTISSVTVVRTADSLGDEVGALDSFTIGYGFGGVTRSFADLITIGSGIDQRQSTLERISFFIKLRIDETPAGGQGSNIGPSMLDDFSFNDGLTFTYLQRETDATPALDRSAFSPFPERLMIMLARRGLVTAVSGTTVTADTKNDPVYVGSQITGTRHLAGNGLETFRNYLIKVADNGDRDTAVSVVAMGSGLDQRQSTLENIKFTSLLRAKLDAGTFDRFDPVSMGSGILGIRVSDNTLENMNMLMLKSAKAGLQRTVSGTTVTALGGDRLFVGQQYGTRRLSGDPLENIGLVTLKTTGIGGGGTSFSVVSSTDTIRPRASYFLNSGVGQTFDDAVLDQAKAINNYKPLSETSAVSDDSQVRDVQKSFLGDPDDINIVSSGGSLRNTSYADISYFAEDYVGDSRSIF